MPSLAHGRPEQRPLPWVSPSVHRALCGPRGGGVRTGQPCSSLPHSTMFLSPSDPKKLRISVLEGPSSQGLCSAAAPQGSGICCHGQGAASLRVPSLRMPSHDGRLTLASSRCDCSAGLLGLPWRALSQGSSVQQTLSCRAPAQRRGDGHRVDTNGCLLCARVLGTPDVHPCSELSLKGRFCYYPLVQKREPRHREVKRLTQGHTAQKWLSDAGAHGLTPTAHAHYSWLQLLLAL